MVIVHPVRIADDGASAPVDEWGRYKVVMPFDVAGETLRLKAHEAGVVTARALRQPVASLRQESHRIVDALDAVISGL